MTDLGMLAYQLVTGFAYTLLLTLAGAIGGLVGGVGLACCRLRGPKFVAYGIDALTWGIITTPFIVQLMGLYFGLPQWAAWRQGPMWTIWRSPVAVAACALALNSSAYSMRILLGAVSPTWRHGQQAASALGIGRLRMLWHVALPSLWAKAKPVWANEALAVMHASTLASAVTAHELYGATSMVGTTLFRPVLAHALGCVGFASLAWCMFACNAPGRSSPLATAGRSL